jgi:hypothetical protein
MDIKQYLYFLFNFYSTASLFPRVQIEIEDEKSSSFTLRAKNAVKVYPYNLCSRIHKVCWIFRKLALKNLKKLEDFINIPDFETFLLTASFDKKGCTFYLYNIYGKAVYKTYIKFFSLNWF